MSEKQMRTSFDRLVRTLALADAKAEGLGVPMSGGFSISKSNSRSNSRRWKLGLTVTGRRRDFGLRPLSTKCRCERAQRTASSSRSPLAYEGKRSDRGQSASRNPPGLPRPSKSVRVPCTTCAARRGAMANTSTSGSILSSITRSPRLAKNRSTPVSTPHVLDVLSPIWTAKPETARRVRQRHVDGT